MMLSSICAIIVLIAQVESRCVRRGDGFFCYARHQDSSENLNVSLSSIETEAEVRVAVFKGVGRCSNTTLAQEEVNDRSNPKEYKENERNSDRRALDRDLTYHSDVLVPKRGHITVHLDKVRSREQCSKMMINSCRVNLRRTDCSEVIRVR